MRPPTASISWDARGWRGRCAPSPSSAAAIRRSSPSSPSAATARSSPRRWRGRSRSPPSSCPPLPACGAPSVSSRPRWSTTSCAPSCGRWPTSTHAISPPPSSLEREAEALLSAQGYGGHVEIERSADLKYQGQSYELAVPLGSGAGGADTIARLAEAFGKEHERTYGHKAEGDPIQI